MSYETSTARGVNVAHANASLQAIETTPLAARIDMNLDEAFQAVAEAEKHLTGLHDRLFGPCEGLSPDLGAVPTLAAWEDNITGRLRYLNQCAGRVQFIAGILSRRI